MMKVLMVGPDKNEKGGIASVVQSYYDVGLDKEVDLQYISTLKSGSNLKKIKIYFVSFLKYLLKIMRTDIVHIHMSYKGSFYRKAIMIHMAKLYKKKIIIHIHGSEFEKFYINSNKILKKFISKTLEKGNLVIALSEEWKDILLRISPKSNIIVIHNSIIVPKYEKKDYISKNILFLGELGERKGVYDILEIFDDIISEFPDVKLTLAGNGDVNEVKSICDKYNFNKNVIIPGWISGDEKNELLKEASIYILPSYNEGMPISILEAMANKLPIISTNVGGIPQMIENGKEGYLINPGDNISMKKALELLLSDVNKRKNMGESSYIRVNNEFNLIKNIDILKGYYRKLVK